MPLPRARSRGFAVLEPIFLWGLRPKACHTRRKDWPSALSLLVVFLWLGSETLQAQDSLKRAGRAVQLSGLVLRAADDRPIPYADIYLPGTYRGTAADASGFFSLVVFTADTVRISAVGFKPWQSVVPDTVTGHLVSVAVRLQADTVRLAPANVYPWPDRGELRRALLTTDVHDPVDDIAPYAGFHRVDNPREPKATPLSPASFFYENVVRKIQKSKRKRKKAKRLPKMP